MQRITNQHSSSKEIEWWEPVEDGEYLQTWPSGQTTLHVYDSGAELEQWVTGNVYKDGSPRVADEISLGEYRLCRRTGTQLATNNIHLTDDEINLLRNCLRIDINALENTINSLPEGEIRERAGWFIENRQKMESLLKKLTGILNDNYPKS